jgi:hypothetical protein
MSCLRGLVVGLLAAALLAVAAPRPAAALNVGLNVLILTTPGRPRIRLGLATWGWLA